MRGIHRLVFDHLTLNSMRLGEFVSVPFSSRRYTLTAKRVYKGTHTASDPNRTPPSPLSLTLRAMKLPSEMQEGKYFPGLQ